MTHITEMSDEQLQKLADSSDHVLNDADKAQIEIRIRKGTRHVLKKYSHRAGAGFLILLAGVAGALYLQGQDREANRSAAVEGRSAIVRSGNAVAVLGCNRDFRQALGVRRILDEGTRTQIAQALADGTIDPMQAQRAIDRIPVNLKLYPLPDCRTAARTVTDDPDSSVRVPHAFYPGDPQSPTLPPGETSKTQKRDSSNGD